MKKRRYLLILITTLILSCIPCSANVNNKTKGYGNRQYTTMDKQTYNNFKSKSYKLMHTIHYTLDKKTKKISMRSIEIYPDEFISGQYVFKVYPMQKSKPRAAANKFYIKSRVKYRVNILKTDGTPVAVKHFYQYGTVKVKEWGKDKVSLEEKSTIKKLD